MRRALAACKPKADTPRCRLLLPLVGVLGASLGCLPPPFREGAMAQHEAWQVGGGAAELYQRYLVPAIASLWAADLIDRAAPRPGERVLDVACGTGVVTRLAAERMGSGRVVGLDINAGMLAVARSLSPGAGPSIE